ncbi:MAG: multidrug efflux SMR transporter [Myxococcota bacterium]|nr:multidrug efflux SMR transporter [Myxococcota bacterium]
MHRYWLLLLAAIGCEVTTSMKFSEGFIPSIAVIVGYIASAVLIIFAIKRIEISIAYAIWEGLGVFLTTIVGACLFKETITLMKMVYTAMRITGVMGLYLLQPAQS